MKRFAMTLALAMVVVGGALFLFETRSPARETEQKRMIMEPCRLESFDLAGRDMVTAVDYRRVAERHGLKMRGDRITVSIFLGGEYQDFLDRYADEIHVTTPPLTLRAKGPEVSAIVPIALLCELSVQPEVQSIEAGVGMLWL